MKALLSLIAAAALFTSASAARAVPTISVDMDSTMAGIQSNVVANLNDILNVSIVITGDGVALFDEAIMDLAYNDFGSVLTLVSGPTAGGLAGAAPLVFDPISALPVLPGDPLMIGLAPVPPGFADSLGGAGLISLFGPFFVIPAGLEVSIMDLTFQVTALGDSTLRVVGFPLGTFPLSLLGQQVVSDLADGSVTTQVVPEPSGAVLFPAGLAVVGLALRRSRERSRLP